MPPGTNLDNVVRSISSKQIPEDSMSPVTTFEVPVSISDPPDPPVTTKTENEPLNHAVRQEKLQRGV